MAPCSIVPPYLLEALARSGNAAQRERAVNTLALDAALRATRARRHAAPTARLGEGVPQPKRTISDAGDTEQLPGRVVREEGQPPVGDVAVDEAYDGLGATFTFYRDVFGRDSIDGHGLPLDATVHVGDKWDNAEWDGERMLFGDGDGELFGRFTASVDVIGHELTHGVTQYDAKLAYHDQPGALNESISDVFGVLVKQFGLHQTADAADWLIGEDLLLPGVKGVALRSMKAPGTAYDDPRLGRDPQPAHLRDYVSGPQDNGGVHVNSGIPSHAFYLAATALGGFAWERAGHAWYDALRDPQVTPETDFAGFAAVTVRAAPDGPAGSAIRDAWGAVGVTA
jgi:Zn-dependent metalloprotease